MASTLTALAIDQLFDNARTYNEWDERPISDDVIYEIYDHLKWGPTSGNSCPGRFVWVRTAEGKAKLAKLAMDVNQTKILGAPVTVIVGYDLAFPSTFAKLFPARAEMMQQMFSRAGMAEITAMRNGTLQGAYLIIAARAMGLNCGPMSGFDNTAVDAAFFPGTSIRSNFLCSLGYGKSGTPYPRNPRLDFKEAGWFA